MWLPGSGRAQHCARHRHLRAAAAFAFGNNQFSHDMVAKPETLSQVSALLTGYLGRAVRLECQMGDHAQVSNMIGVAQPEDEGSGEDPLLTFALADLGASVNE
ncbi:MAG: hypothetical protein HC802_20475 [Caldilineaceae bacterium]|nr:hypothetical protein [Caldilineaceae bacterium]